MKREHLGIGLAILLVLAALFPAACGDGKPPAGKAETPPPAAATGAVKQPAPAAAGPETKAPKSCYDTGYLIGRCAAKSMSNQPCEPGEDIPMPAECKGKPETEKGLKDGRKSVF